MEKIEKTIVYLDKNQAGYSTLILGIVIAVIGCCAGLHGLGYLLLPLTVELEPWIVFGVALYLICCGLTIVLRGIAARNRSKLRTSEKRFTQECYQDYPWDPQGINDDPNKKWRDVLLGIILLSFMLLPLNYLSFSESGGGWVWQAIAVIFDLVMLVLLLSFGYFAVQAFRYGKSRVLFNRFPFFPGERLEVRFLNKGFSKITFSLRYIKEKYEKSGIGEDAKKEVACYELYRDNKQVNVPSLTRQVKIHFTLPENPSWTNDLRSRESVYYWELEVYSEQRGVDYCSSFLMPVYQR